MIGSLKIDRIEWCQNMEKMSALPVQPSEAAAVHNASYIGPIQRVHDPIGNKQYSVQEFSLLLPETTKKKLFTDLEIAKTMNHPNIAKVTGYFIPEKPDDFTGSLSMEDLNGIITLTQASSNGLACEDKIKIISGIALGVKYIHGRGYFYGRLNMDNVIMGQHCCPKLINYAFPADFEPGTKYPDEMIGAVDVFAFGKLLSELFCGTNFSGNLVSSQLPKKWILDLIGKCSSANPLERPTFGEIVQKIKKMEPRYIHEFELLALNKEDAHGLYELAKEQQTTIAKLHDENSLQKQQISRYLSEIEALKKKIGQNKCAQCADTTLDNTSGLIVADWSFPAVIQGKGIFQEIQRIKQKNVQAMGEIKVISSTSTFGNCYYTMTNWSTSQLYLTQNIPNSWIRFDFRAKKVSVTGYEIESSLQWFLKNWVIEGTDNEDYKESWDTIDTQNNNQKLNSEGAIAVFVVSPPSKPYRFIRIRQTGENHQGKDYLELRHFDLFGNVFFVCQ